MNVIECVNVSKRFPLMDASGADIRGITNDFFNDGRSFFLALKNISFSLAEGKIFGVVGRNGAGKTTLLNLIAGINTATDGEITVNGKVASLFSLGTGFQEELSGEENIFLNGSLLGMKDSEIREKYASILSFSELNEFIHQPLGSYSQGMKLRLGFSVAIHLDFDIFVIDEVLMVGDGAFQQKCFEKLAEFRRAGKTMVITSQNLDLVERLSDEVMLLERGEISEYGDPKACIAAYKKILNENRALHVYSDTVVWHETKWWAEEEEEWPKREGTKEVEILSVEFISRWGRRVDKIQCGDPLEVRVHLQVNEEIRDPHFGIALFRDDRVYCYGPNTEFDSFKIDSLRQGKRAFSLAYKRFDCMPGRYYFSIAVWDTEETIAYDYIKGTYSIDVVGSNPNRQLIHINSCFDGERIRKHPDTQASALFDLKTIEESWAVTSTVGEGRIQQIRCLNWLDEEKDDFFTGEKASIEINYVPGETEGRLLWIGIFRSDRIFCFSRIRALKEKDGKTTLSFPALSLLPGRYYISVGIWNSKTRDLEECLHGAYSFAMHCRREDHGTIYLEHKWKLKGVIRYG